MHAEVKKREGLCSHNVHTCKLVDLNCNKIESITIETYYAQAFVFLLSDNWLHVLYFRSSMNPSCSRLTVCIRSLKLLKRRIKCKCWCLANLYNLTYCSSCLWDETWLNCFGVFFASVKLKHFEKFQDTTEALAGNDASCHSAPTKEICGLWCISVSDLNHEAFHSIRHYPWDHKVIYFQFNKDIKWTFFNRISSNALYYSPVSYTLDWFHA